MRKLALSMMFTLVGLVGCSSMSKETVAWNGGGVGEGVQPPGQGIVKVLYGTNRTSLPLSCSYGKGRSEGNLISYGECDVSFPVDHLIGQIESPYFKWMRRKAEKHVVVLGGRELSKEQFLSKLESGLKEEGAALLFVHGYNVSFSDALMRTAQLSYDLEFEGAPLMFSWPSFADEASYFADEAAVAWSYPAMYRFLKDVLADSGVKKLYIIAHSMGNKAVTDALVRLGDREPMLASKIGGVVLAAPDIDYLEFTENIAPSLAAVGAPITMYVSSEDVALKASKAFRRAARAGDLVKPVRVVDGIDLVDASAVKTDFLGHSYYGSDVSVLSDIHSFIRGEAAQKRFFLQPATGMNGQYWVFKRNK